MTAFLATTEAGGSTARAATAAKTASPAATAARARAGNALAAVPAQACPVAGDDLRIEAGAVLERALLGREVHVDDAEALGKAVRPFEIVQQRPVHIALHLSLIH